MPFPEADRVVYDNNPLEQVICQLRFPPILRIDTEVPARFQEEVRQEYPLFVQKVGPELPPQFQDIPIPEGFFQSNKAYEFRTEDELWTISLTQDFLALTTRKYERWEDFKEHLKIPLQALLDEYKPSFFSRVGLRYQNVIRRSDIGLSGVEWYDLLQPYIAAELTSDVILDSSIVEAAHNLIIHLSNSPAQVRVHHGLVQNLKDSDGNTCYLIDNDFFTDERTNIDDVWHVLNHFNQRSRRLFRWCITDSLHEAMGPIPTSIST